MAQKPYSEMSLNELKNQEKTLKTVTYVLGGVLIVQFVVGIALSFTKGFSVFSILPFAFLPLMIINVNNLKKIKAEIATRN